MLVGERRLRIPDVIVCSEFACSNFCMVRPSQALQPTDLLLSEITNEAESNDGIKQIICQRDGSLVVKYQNGFWNRWFPGYGGGGWPASALKTALLVSRSRKPFTSAVVAPGRRTR